jgi:hypothetical protein
MPRLRVIKSREGGIAQKKMGGIHFGRLKTSRTSGGIAAKNFYEKFV